MEFLTFPFTERKWVFCLSLSLSGFLILLFINHGSISIDPLLSSGFGTALKEDGSGCGMELSRLEERVSSVGREEKCELFNGSWVYDPWNYPLYEGRQCPFLSNQVNCRKNGRPDSNYEHWKWQPRHCQIPRFNGTDLLEKWRGKRAIIVGDSLNRNQWESLVCLLYIALPPSRTYVDAEAGNYKVFQARDYNCTVEFFWSPFLVQTDEAQMKWVKLDRISESAQQWKGADVMVFNTGHWWVHHAKYKIWDFFENEGKQEKEMELERAYEIALTTWARWIDNNVDANKTSVFFRNISPEHKGSHWCYNQTLPIGPAEESYQDIYPKGLTEITEKTLERMRSPIKYLDIKRLSEYRQDAHTTVYTVRQEKLLTEEERKQPEKYADCSHWCLPGLPDIWNELLYAFIVL